MENNKKIISRWLSGRGRVKRSESGNIIDPSLDRGPNGFVLCRFCRKETRSTLSTFCNSKCVHNFKLRTQPHYLRFNVFNRDQGVCQNCRTDCNSLYQKACELKTVGERLSFFLSLGDDLWKTKARRCLESCKISFTAGMFWEAAHIVDVQDGGGASGLENIRTLCVPCHKRETLDKLKIKKALTEKDLNKEFPKELNSSSILTKTMIIHEPTKLQNVVSSKTRESNSQLHKSSDEDYLELRHRSTKGVLMNSAFSKGNHLSFDESLKDTQPISSQGKRMASSFITEPSTSGILENEKAKRLERNLGPRKGLGSKTRGAKRRCFSRLEIDTLIVGINQFGYCWSKIKDEYSSIFRLRSQIDLKDKARNLAKKNPNFLNI